MSSSPRPSRNTPEVKWRPCSLLWGFLIPWGTMKSLRKRVSGRACSRSWAYSVRSCQRVGRFNDDLKFYLSDKKKEARLEELLKKEQSLLLTRRGGCLVTFALAQCQFLDSFRHNYRHVLFLSYFITSLKVLIWCWYSLKLLVFTKGMIWHNW